MSLKRKLLILCGAVLFCALLLVGITSARAYSAARIAAEKYVANASDGPWLPARVRLIVGDSHESSCGPALQWVFRFRNPHSGNQSKRIYVSFSGSHAFTHRYLDPVPFLGSYP